jgi:hypothetical protein
VKACKACKALVDELAIFPGGICLACHEKKFDAEVARNGGRLPRPDFVGAITGLTFDGEASFTDERT